MSNRQTATSHSNTPSESENDKKTTPAENITESLKSETSVESNTNPTGKTQQNPPETAESAYSEKFTGHKQIPCRELQQQQFCEVFSSEQTQVEKERLRIQHQRRVESENQLIRKQELAQKQLIQQVNQLGY